MNNLERIERHLAQNRWIFLSVYEGSDGRRVQKYYHPTGAFVLVEQFAPIHPKSPIHPESRGAVPPAVEVYAQVTRENSVEATLRAVDALVAEAGPATDPA